MEFSKQRIGGLLIYLGGIQWTLGLLLAEAWHPTYNSRIDYVSDLTIGPTALIFNVTVFLLGLCIVLGAYLLTDSFRFRLLTLFLYLSGIGAMGVGLFSIDTQPIHSIFTLLALLFGGLAALVSFKVQKPPISYVSVILGLVSLSATFLFMPYLGLPVGSTETFLGMAKGSMERWVIFPVIAWTIGFGGYLSNQKPES